MMDRAFEQKKHDLHATLSELINRLRAIEKEPLPFPESLAQRNGLVEQACAKLNVPPGSPSTENTYVHRKYCAALLEFAHAIAQRCADLGMPALFEIPEEDDSWGGPTLVVWTDPFTGITRGLKPKTDSIDYLRPIETMFRYLQTLATPDYQVAKQAPWNQEKRDQWRKEQEGSIKTEQWAKHPLDEPRVAPGERQTYTKSSPRTPASDGTAPRASGEQTQDVDADSAVPYTENTKKPADSGTDTPIEASAEEAPDSSGRPSDHAAQLLSATDVAELLEKKKRFILSTAKSRVHRALPEDLPRHETEDGRRFTRGDALVWIERQEPRPKRSYDPLKIE